MNNNNFILTSDIHNNIYMHLAEDTFSGLIPDESPTLVIIGAQPGSEKNKFSTKYHKKI
jgi:hypothetical protein